MGKSRLLNDVIILSQKINNISEGAENLFYRLLVSSDDFGRYHAKPEIIKGKIYTLRKISNSLIIKRINELQEIGLIKLYKNNSELYLEIIKFEKYQRFRADIKRKEEFPVFNKGSRTVNVTTCTEPERVVNEGLYKSKSKEEKKREKEETNSSESIRKRIIDYFNEKAEKKFSSKVEKTIELINGRLKEGRVFEDFKYVIDVKVSKWKSDSKWNDFLRPSTLFAKTNFENYLNEKLSIDDFEERTRKALRNR